jgi:hypothetical protein
VSGFGKYERFNNVGMSAAVQNFQRAHPIQMYPDEIELITAAIGGASPGALMVEWGTGASTVKWLQEMRGDQKLIAIEHSKSWHALVRQALDAAPELSERCDYHLCEGSAYWQHGYGQPREENPMGLDRYFAPTDRIFDGDIFLVDGVARGVCLLFVLLRSRKPDPIIFVHDWHQRQPWYSWAVDTFPRHELVATTLLRLWK